MKNNLKDLNNTLFAQLELLADDEAMKEPEVLKREIARSKAMSEIAGNIIDVANLQLEAIKMKKNMMLKDEDLTELTYSKKDVKALI